jgi:hypothetical protein
MKTILKSKVIRVIKILVALFLISQTYLEAGFFTSLAFLSILLNTELTEYLHEKEINGIIRHRN